MCISGQEKALRNAFSVENKLLNNEIKVVIATTALGMGFDKPDLGFLIHLGIPKTLTDYYQQIGRAGRKLENADCVLISLPDDDDVNEYFIMNKVPEQPISDTVLSLIPNTPDEIDLNEIDISKIDASRYKIKKIAEIALRPRLAPERQFRLIG